MAQIDHLLQSPPYSFSDLPTIPLGHSTHPPSRFQPTGKKLTQLLLPFPLVPRQDWLALEKKRDLERREEIVDRLALAEMKKIKKDIKRREYERKRKREQRRRRKEEGVARKLVQLLSLKRTLLNLILHPILNHTTSNGSLPRLKKARMRPTKRMNWCHPLVWPIIQQAANRVGFPWSPQEIVRQLQQIDPTLFATLRPQRISQWRDHTVTDSLQWKESHMQAIQAGAQVNREEAGRRGIFHNHPQVVQSIRSCLLNLRQAGVPLGLNLIRGYMVGMIRHYIPDAFTRTYRNGQPFQCSTEFVRLFLREQLGWSLRKGTRAAQKYPPNVNTVLHDAYLRFACAVRDEDIPSCCIVNADQTQVVYNPGDQKTWTTAGDRQIHIVGSEDKRAFTLMVGISSSGDLLPFQAIYAGRSARSVPNSDTPEFQQALTRGFCFDFSNTNNYWSSFGTMCLWVTRILVPYFLRKRVENNLPSDQKCILQVDCWAVHRSAQFREWMSTNYPWIIILYVPGGCTGLFQACDVGIQRILKLAIAKASHADIVVETLTALQSGIAANAVVNDQTLHTLRNRSVGWLLKAYDAVNKPELIKKAFALCTVPGTELNLSYESLTSRLARQAILDLRHSNPELYASITFARGHDSATYEDEIPDTS
ncbi:DDE superfamily endonuclease, partial [Rhizoctonia solani 123E]